MSTPCSVPPSTNTVHPLNSMQGSGGQKPRTMCLPDPWASPRTETSGDEDSLFVLTLAQVLCVKALNLGLVLGKVSSVLARTLLLLM